MTHSLPRRNFLKETLIAGAGFAASGRQILRAETHTETGHPDTPVKIRTLGTGASDHDWKNFGSPGVRGSSGTLIDGHVLIDCGTTGSANLARFSVSSDALTDLLITHSHADHFHIGEIQKVIAGRAQEKPLLNIWASPEAIAALNKKLSGRFAGHELTPGQGADIGRLHMTALPANHLLGNPSEHALHFLIETPRGNLLYALDGAWMLKQARQLIGNKRLSMIIWDATLTAAGDYRIFEHNDLSMIGLMMQSLTSAGIVDAKTVCVLDHLARSLWPSDLRQAEQLASDRGWVLAADGMELELR